ncbi:hypothetical protein [Ectopseudomonas oleovorans]|uniref:hypothetical protein n=1 Tax=Ectopseudomonas oleovorans TaxID=301 RepID=UPI00244A0691|nr:hypothetical protein [Pseudomonas oleovorans]MDH2198750.1 hypothetical protein [Pseudomonas oleovorans]
MNFIACDGEWSAGATGEPRCTGQLVSITGAEIRAELSPGLTDEEAITMLDAAVGVFATVFIFLVLKKLVR